MLDIPLDVYVRNATNLLVKEFGAEETDIVISSISGPASHAVTDAGADAKIVGLHFNSLDQNTTKLLSFNVNIEGGRALVVGAGGAHPSNGVSICYKKEGQSEETCANSMLVTLLDEGFYSFELKVNRVDNTVLVSGYASVVFSRLTSEMLDNAYGWKLTPLVAISSQDYSPFIKCAHLGQEGSTLESIDLVVRVSGPFLGFVVPNMSYHDSNGGIFAISINGNPIFGSNATIKICKMTNSAAVAVFKNNTILSSIYTLSELKEAECSLCFVNLLPMFKRIKGTNFLSLTSF